MQKIHIFSPPPLDVEKWKNAGDIDLRNNQLTSLPPEVGQWKNANLIDLGNNQLTSLPPELEQWKNVKTIDSKIEFTK